MFSLPQHYGTKFITVSNGLLILQIPEQLEYSTIAFQCFYPDRQGLEIQASSIGHLTVKRPRKNHNDFSSELLQCIILSHT